MPQTGGATVQPERPFVLIRLGGTVGQNLVRYRQRNAVGGDIGGIELLPGLLLLTQGEGSDVLGRLVLLRTDERNCLALQRGQGHRDGRSKVGVPVAGCNAELHIPLPSESNKRYLRAVLYLSE